MRGIFTSGTDTSIGKTWIGAQLIAELCKQGFNVTPRKPVESGWNQRIQETDAWILAKAANKADQIDLVCPNRFTQAISPARAARLEGRNLSTQHLLADCLSGLRQPQKKTDFLYIEGAGGFYSPLAQDGLNSDLAKQLNLPILLVAENRLGCINQVLLSVAAIESAKLRLAGVILNQATCNANSEAKENISEIKQYKDYPIIPFGFQENNPEKIRRLVDLVLNVNTMHG